MTTITPAALAAILAALTPRIRRRLDADPGQARAWSWGRDDAGSCVRVAEQCVRLPDGLVDAPGSIRCDCLLAPACLHIAAVASVLDVEPGGEPVSGTAIAPDNAAGSPPDTPAASRPGFARPQADGSAPDRDVAERAAAGAWAAGADVLATGLDASGSLQRAALLQSAHEAQLARLPRLARAALRAAAAVTDDGEAATTSRARDLGELLEVSWWLGGAPDGPDNANLDPEWVGVARRAFDSIEATMLHAIAAERVETASGFAGVITYFADNAGQRYQFGDVRPGGSGRIADAYRGATRLGGLATGHEQLSRSRVFAQGLRVSPEGRIGSGAQASATIAGPSDWDSEPLARLWGTPAARQLQRAQRAPSNDLDALMFLRVRSAGIAARGLALRTDDGVTVTAIPAPGTERLQRAMADTDAWWLVVARPDPEATKAGMIRLIALTQACGPADRPRVMVGLDEPPAGFFAAARGKTGDETNRADRPPGARRLRAEPEPADAEPTAAPPTAPTPTAPTPSALAALDVVVSRCAIGGRLAVGAPATGQLRALREQLTRSQLPGAADVLENLHRAALRSERDRLGELHYPPASRFAAAWLAAETYVRATCDALALDFVSG